MNLTRRVLFVLLLSAFPLTAQHDPFILIPPDQRSNPPEFVEDKSLVTDIEFVGLDPKDDGWGLDGKQLSETALTDRLRWSKKIIRKGDFFSSEKVLELTNEVKTWLSINGYPTATVQVLGLPLPENQLRLRIEVARGPAVSTINISFSGNERVASNDLLDKFKACGDGTWKEYDERAYQYIAQKCVRELMFSRGLWKAKIVDIKTSIVGSERNVNVIVEEGPLYRLGEIKVEGNTVFSRNEIVDMVDQKPGTIADGAAFQKVIFDILKERYDERGYVQYQAEFDPTYVEAQRQGLDGTLNVLITINEGQRFTVRGVRFAGGTDDEATALVSEFSLKAGEIYTGKKLEKAVERLNELGRFQSIDKDQHVNIFTDEKARDVELVINVKKREP